MCLDKTALLDHLVGEREHPWRYVDSERPRCLNVDDKLELRRLQYWQIGGLSALEDAASIGANLTNHFYLVASIAHQPVGCDIAPLRVSRRYPFARGQDRLVPKAARVAVLVNPTNTTTTENALRELMHRNRPRAPVCVIYAIQPPTHCLRELPMRVSWWSTLISLIFVR